MDEWYQGILAMNKQSEQPEMGIIWKETLFLNSKNGRGSKKGASSVEQTVPKA